MSDPDPHVRALLARATQVLQAPEEPQVLLRHHGTQVWHLPAAGAVVRIGPEHQHTCAHRSLALTRWAHVQGVAVTEPALDHVLQAPGLVATAWTYHRPHPERSPSPADLGRLLRALHHAGTPPVPLPEHDPLAPLLATLDEADCLAPGTVADLRSRARELRKAYRGMESPLGVGPVHGDAWMGNVLLGADNVARLGDWDESALAPRELDLANLFQGARRFGRTDAELEAFTDAYGHDPREWEGLEVLIRIRDLHTLGSYVRAADRGDAQALEQLHRRIDTLDEAALWNSR